MLDVPCGWPSPIGRSSSSLPPRMPLAPPRRAQDGGALRSGGRCWGSRSLTPFPTLPLGAQRRESRGQGPGGDRGTCVAGPRARAQPAPPPPGPGPTPSVPGLRGLTHHRACGAEASPRARAHVHCRGVWPRSFQTACLQSRDRWTRAWAPFPPLRPASLEPASFADSPSSPWGGDRSLSFHVHSRAPQILATSTPPSAGSQPCLGLTSAAL